MERSGGNGDVTGDVENSDVNSTLSPARLKVQRTNWKKLAGNELLKIQSKIVSNRQKRIKDNWHRNREKNTESLQQRANDDEGLSPHPAEIRRKYNYKIRRNTAAASFRDIFGRQGKREIVPHILPAIPNLPTNFMWMPSQRNIASDDEKVLLNIPYMGDHVVENERHFLEDLINMHQRKMQCGGGDEAVHGLIDVLFKIEKEKDPNATVPCPEIFEAVSCLLAEKGTPETIRDKYRESQLPTVEHSNSLPSIDDDNAQWETKKRDKLLNSFHELICPRCYRYDCNQHTYQYRPPAHHYILKRKLDMPKIPAGPCGSACFLHVPNGRDCVESMFKLKKSKPKNTAKKAKKDDAPNSSTPVVPDDESSNDKTNVENVASPESLRDGFENQIKQLSPATLELADDELWTQSDQVLLRSLMEVYQGNFCVISKCMKNKSCKQIFSRCIKGDFLMQSQSSDEWVTSHPARKKPLGHTKRKTPVNRKDTTSHNIHNFEPCDHPGEACGPTCACVIRGNYCEKFCACANDCRNRFAGCNCKGQCNTKLCPCHHARRECDSEICKLCGADDFDHDDASQLRCQNVKIQRGEHKHLLLAPSDVAGWGIYIKHDVGKDEFISEYCGELISQEEADRRGKVYDKHKCSFLFDLNTAFCVDATRKGNKIRFANHSLDPNCQAKIMRVNGDHRIGIFANRAIKMGEELFFDYRYNTTDAIKYVGLERNGTELREGAPN